MKRKLLEIESCIYCKYYDRWELALYDEESKCYFDEKQPKLIGEISFNINYIPDWCPLEDVKEDKL